ncbi:DMT family transporter [Alicyclobacillus fastidiosus]|uniref:DMT family transporter n=1 Tax=Alicyclobacillus fastidiosus TaxID=392011 RepID=A0ABY6ZEJ9_9BACL|nr:DMT family transporter [Alicyclobacillus fastidiosus]WAH40927.1 DMT family transporter [Alicyclobacillus fastidiosus]GMA62430.1 multidrug transporter [Alicyclobacillus fastidiosus]
MNISTSTTRTSRPVVLTSLMIALLAISFSAIFIEWSTAPAAVIGMYRLWMSVLLLSPFAVKRWREFMKLSPRDIGLVCLSGLFLGLHFLFWIQSLRMTSVASSMIIIALEPIFVLVGSVILFRSRVTKMGMLSMLFAILGCVVVASADFGKGTGHVYGDFLSLVGTLAVSVYMLAGQKVRSSVSSTTYNVLVFLVAGLVLFLFNVLTKTPLVAYSGHNWLMFTLLAVVSTVIGHGLFNWLLDRVSATTISMTILGEPVGAIILAYLLLGQPVLLLQGIGSVMSIFGVFWFLRASPSHQADDKENPAGQETDSAYRGDGPERFDAGRA